MMIVPFYPLLCKRRTFSYSEACGKPLRITSLPEPAPYSAKVLNAALKKFNFKRTKIKGGYNLNSPGQRKR